MMKLYKKPCGLHCIKIKNLGVTLGNQEILTNINLHIHCGTLNVIIGRNGAGKSTLIRALLGEIPHSGVIEFKNTEEGHVQRMRVGYVPQKINIEKQTPVSVFDMMASYQYHVPIFLRKTKRAYKQVKEALDVFEVGDLIDMQVCNLSGGQLQRVLLSMALMNKPNLLLLDEPISGIDQNGTALFYETIDHLKKNYDLAVILISHDLDYVKKYADHVVLLDQTILKQGTPREVFLSEEFANVFSTV